jgi:3-methyladenine DNA glycosylase/8-oxoguanine DNA glycosylase
VRFIVYQQLSGRVALRIFERLLDLIPQRRLTPAAVLALRVEQMRAAGLITRAWRPWCSVASWCLWRSLDGEAAL